MIVLFDSFGSYTSKSTVSDRYPVNRGGVGTVNFKAANKFDMPCMDFRSWWLRADDLQNPALAGSDVCVTGFWFNADQHFSQSPVVRLLGAGGDTANEVQLNLVNNSTASKYWFEVVHAPSQTPREVLAVSSELIPGQWVFVELKVVFDQTAGSVEIRLGGVTDAKETNLRTEVDGTNRRWSSVYIGSFSQGECFISDWYVLNGAGDVDEHNTFLGPTSIVTQWPDGDLSRIGHVADWAPAPRQMNKHRLVILAGHSNMDGLVPTTSSTAVSPNSSIWTWDYLSGPAQLNPLVAGTNNNGHFRDNIGGIASVVGPEMQFAENVKEYFDERGFSEPLGQCVVVKGAQKDSYLWYFGPVAPGADFGWHPDYDGNLWNDKNSAATGGRSNLLQDINDAVAALGGWSAIDRVDFFWEHGRSDASFSQSAAVYKSNLEAFFARVRSDLSAAPDLHFHLVQLHKDLPEGDGPDQGGVWWRDQIRFEQFLVAQAASDVTLLNVDRVSLDPGFNFAAGTKGINRFADLITESWFSKLSFVEGVDDLRHGGPENLDFFYHNVAGRKITFPATGTQILRAVDVFAVRASLYGSGTNQIALHFSDGDSGATSSQGILFVGSSFERREVIEINDPLTDKRWSSDRIEKLQPGFEVL